MKTKEKKHLLTRIPKVQSYNWTSLDQRVKSSKRSRGEWGKYLDFNQELCERERERARKKK